jgi:hypothetical protein
MTGQGIQDNRKWLYTGAWLLVPAYIGAINYWLGWPNISEAWTHLRLMEGLVALLLLLLACALTAWRLYDYFPHEMTGRWLGSLRLTLLHNLQTQFHPVRAQHSVFPRLMKTEFSIDYARALSAQLWLRLLDIHALLTFAFYPLLVVTPLKRVALPIVVLWMVLPVVLYLFSNRIEVHFAGKDGTLSQLAQQTLFGLPDNWGEFWRCWLMTWAIWVVKLVTLAWLLGQFLPDVSWNMLLLGVVAAELTIALPLYLPANLGLYEAGIILALMAATTTLPMALASAVNLHLFLLLAALLGGLTGWLLPAKK